MEEKDLTKKRKFQDFVLFEEKHMYKREFLIFRRAEDGEGTYMFTPHFFTLRLFFFKISKRGSALLLSFFFSHLLKIPQKRVFMVQDMGPRGRWKRKAKKQKKGTTLCAFTLFE